MVGDGAPERCSRCGRKDAVGFTTESYEAVFGATLKARSRLQMHGKAQKVLEILKKSALIKKEFGDDALYVSAGRGIRLSEAPALLRKRKEIGLDLIDCVIEGEREAL